MALIPILVRPIGGRAGTTLLMQLLGTSSEIAFDRIYPFERSYFSYLLERTNGMIPGAGERPSRARRATRRLARKVGTKLPPWADLRTPKAVRGPSPLPRDPQIFDLETFARLSFERQWEAFSEAVLRKSRGTKPTYYAEKFPRVEPSALDIPTKLLWLVRDPRDQWTSIHAFDRKRGYYGFGRGRWQTRSSYLHSFVRRTREYAEREATRSDDDLLVRYEDLVAELEGEAARLGTWLDVELDPGPVRESWSGLSRHMTSRSPHASIGRWRQDLPEKEQETLTRELAAVLDRYGYEH